MSGFIRTPRFKQERKEQCRKMRSLAAAEPAKNDAAEAAAAPPEAPTANQVDAPAVKVSDVTEVDEAVIDEPDKWYERVRNYVPSEAVGLMGAVRSIHAAVNQLEDDPGVAENDESIRVQSETWLFVLMILVICTSPLFVLLNIVRADRKVAKVEDRAPYKWASLPKRWKLQILWQMGVSFVATTLLAFSFGPPFVDVPPVILILLEGTAAVVVGIVEQLWLLTAPVT